MDGSNKTLSVLTLRAIPLECDSCDGQGGEHGRSAGEADCWNVCGACKGEGLSQHACFCCDATRGEVELFVVPMVDDEDAVSCMACKPGLDAQNALEAEPQSLASAPRCGWCAQSCGEDCIRDTFATLCSRACLTKLEKHMSGTSSQGFANND